MRMTIRFLRCRQAVAAAHWRGSPAAKAGFAETSGDETDMATVVDFPPSETLRPEQAVGEVAKVKWDQFIGLGVTAEGDFEVVNSEMTAERALWLLEWGRRWALGLDEED